MAHTLIIGGQPDYLSQRVATWDEHGREITAGDAEKVLDQAPSVRHRAPSIGSGEHFYKTNLATWMNGLPERGICGVVHNLQDVGAKVRATVCNGSPGYEMVMPTATVASSNTTSTHADVDQNPYGTITTYATPTVQTTDYHLEVGFANSDPLQLDVEDSQIILVYLRQTGTHGTSITSALIQVKEGAVVRASKNLRVRLANTDTMVVSVLVDPNDFDNPTLDDMSVRVTCDQPTSGGGFVNWDIGAIVWQKFEQPVSEGTFGLTVDTGWVDVDSAPVDLYHMSTDGHQAHSVLPYLDGNGEVAMTSAQVLRVLFTWDETSVFNGTSFDMKDRIFAGTDGTLTNWRPEIGVVAEGPAWGTDRFQFGNRPTVGDRSQIVYSPAGNRWVPRRREPTKTHEGLRVFPLDVVEFVEEVYSVASRAGTTMPFLLCIRPDMPSVRAALSMYAYMTSIEAPTEAKIDVNRDGILETVASVTMSFEEAL